MINLLMRLYAQILRYPKEERASTAIEYGLIVAFIGIVIAGTIFAIGGDMAGLFGVISEYISSV